MLSRRRHDKIPTLQSLENVALFYLSRFAASEGSLRRVLKNKLRRVALRNPQFAADQANQNQLCEAIEAIIQKHKKTGVINDEAYAGMKIASLRRAGRSARAIKQKLAQKGLARGTIEQAFDRGAEEENFEVAEFKAALSLAKRRRLGAYRKSKSDPEQNKKDLATLARAGFSLAIARRALNGLEEDI